MLLYGIQSLANVHTDLVLDILHTAYPHEVLCDSVTQFIRRAEAGGAGEKTGRNVEGIEDVLERVKDNRKGRKDFFDEEPRWALQTDAA